MDILKAMTRTIKELGVTKNERINLPKNSLAQLPKLIKEAGQEQLINDEIFENLRFVIKKSLYINIKGTDIQK